MELQRFQIERSNRITNAGVIALAKSVTQLTSLYLKHLLITDAAIQAVGVYCRALRHLDVSYCTSLTDAALSTLNVTSLFSLNISGTRVTGTFAAHILSARSSVEYLVCNPGAHLNDFVYSIPICNKLATLNLGMCLLTEADWLELSKRVPKLYELDIHNAQVVNDDVVLSFRAHCPDLLTMTVTGCNVSPAVLKLIDWMN